MSESCSFCGEFCTSYLTTCNECEESGNEEDTRIAAAYTQEIKELKKKLLRMAYWINDTVESELDPEECQDDCAYQDALEILAENKK